MLHADIHYIQQSGRAHTRTQSDMMDYFSCNRNSGLRLCAKSARTVFRQRQKRTVRMGQNRPPLPTQFFAGKIPESLNPCFSNTRAHVLSAYPDRITRYKQNGKDSLVRTRMNRLYRYTDTPTHIQINFRLLRSTIPEVSRIQ